MKAHIDDAVRELQASLFYQRLTASLAAAVLLSPAAPLLPSLRHLVIYGLGSLEQPGAVHILYQAALASLLPGLLPALSSPPEAYDPVFGPLDAAVLPLLGLSLTALNEEGRRVAHQPTLFFMPHCEAELADNLIAVNTGAGTLGNVVILGNSFAQYRDRWAVAHGARLGAAKRPATLLGACERGEVREVGVEEWGFPVAAAFNDLGLHTFFPQRGGGGPGDGALR